MTLVSSPSLSGVYKGVWKLPIPETKPLASLQTKMLGRLDPFLAKKIANFQRV